MNSKTLKERMNIISLKLHNIFSYEDVSIDFADTDFSIFVGKTGSGKTAIFDGMLWTLYDRTARKSYNKTKVLRNVPTKQKECSGQLVFSIGKLTYTVFRKYSNRLILKLYQGNNDISKRTSTMVQEQINELVGVDYDTFINIAYFSQGDIGRFLTSDSSKRIQIISDLLRLDVFDSATKICNTRLNHQQTNISNLSGRISVLDEQISNVDFKALQKKKRTAQTALDEVYNKIIQLGQWLTNAKEKQRIENELKQKKLMYEQQVSHSNELLRQKLKDIKSIDKMKAKIVRIKDKKKQYIDESTKMDNLKAQSAKLKKLIKKNERLAEKYMTMMKLNNDEISNIRTTIKNVKSGKFSACPVCMRPMDKKSLIHLIAKIDEYENENLKYKNKLNKIYNVIKTTNKELDGVTKQIDRINTSIISELSRLNSEEQMLIDKIKIAKIEKENYLELKKSENDKIKAIRMEYRQIQKDLKYYDGYDTKLIDEKEKEAKKYDDMLIELDKMIAQYKFQQAETTAKVKQLAKLKVEIKKEQGEYDLLMRWKLAFPTIKLNMINSVVPFIQSETNKNLSSVLQGKRIVLNVEPSKSTNKLSIIIEDYEHGINRQFDGWSGGQKDTMSLSIFLALNRLASLKSGKQLPFLILDEKFSSVDYESRNAIIELLKEQAKHRKIWVISHVENLDVNFNQVFKTEMKNGISTLERTR